jgi:hypothetical protein
MTRHSVDAAISIFVKPNWLNLSERLNEAVAGAPADVTFGVHMCRIRAGSDSPRSRQQATFVSGTETLRLTTFFTSRRPRGLQLAGCCVRASEPRSSNRLPQVKLATPKAVGGAGAGRFGFQARPPEKSSAGRR